MDWRKNSCSRLFETGSASSVCRATCVSRAKERRRAACLKRESSRSQAVLLIAGWIRRKIARSLLIVVRTVWTSSARARAGITLRSATLSTKLSTTRRSPARSDSSGLSERQVRFILTFKNFFDFTIIAGKGQSLVGQQWPRQGVPIKNVPSWSSSVKLRNPAQRVPSDDQKICRAIRINCECLLGVLAAPKVGVTAHTSAPDLGLQPQQAQRHSRAASFFPLPETGVWGFS